MNAKRISAAGIAMSFIPEDRLGMGLAPSLSVADNVILKDYSDTKGLMVDRKRARSQAESIVKMLNIATPSIDTPVRRLSGGNVQKVLLGREIKSDPDVLITAYPVRGLDINSSYTIYDIINEQKKKGVGVLFIGEDLDVMMALCDKIMVMCHGRLQGVVHANKVTKEELGLMMTGAVSLVNVKADSPAGIARDSAFTEEEWEEASDMSEGEDK
jgi:simple sugar transport system ATP-binding protein